MASVTKKIYSNKMMAVLDGGGWGELLWSSEVSLKKRHLSEELEEEKEWVLWDLGEQH